MDRGAGGGPAAVAGPVSAATDDVCSVGTSHESREKQRPDEIVEIVDDAFSPTKIPREMRRLWDTSKERAVWLADLRLAGTATRLAYCVASLEQRATPMLRTIHRAALGTIKK